MLKRNTKMKSTIRLFKSVPITKKGKRKTPKPILEETIKRGFVFSPEVVYNYSDTELVELIKTIQNEFGLTAEQMNNSFHKSWKKVKTASIEQLVIEQIIHYITTYGYETLGIYSDDTVFIPEEKLEIPKLNVKGFNFVVIRGYTKEELKEKLLSLLQTGIALSDETKKDIVDVCLFVEINNKEIASIRNKEVRCVLYDFLDVIPEDPTEFLRYAIYKSTNKTLLIKNKKIIEEIKSKENENVDVLALFYKYKNKYGFEKLSQIFYRFKPLFLAFKTNTQMKHYINKIRKLAKKNHKPMKPDYLNDVTSMIKHGVKINKDELKEELEKVNTFRKIRLAYALKYRTKDVDSILYKIRNGKGYATDFNFEPKDSARDVLKTVLSSIVEDVAVNVKGKKIYIPENIVYAIPATEKQFTGNLPSGTYVTIPKDIIVGIHWEDVDLNRIDLDLSLISTSKGKFGWNSYYRSEGGDILFSGDMTSAPKPNGASELYYIKRQTKDYFIMMVNYFNYDESIEVPLKIMVAKEEVKNFSYNYTVNPNNIICIAKTKINKKQRILGLLVTTTENSRFYFSEVDMGNSIVSSDKKYMVQSRDYLFNFYEGSISLNELLTKAGAKLVDDKEDCDIDLSPENLEKDKIINLLKKREK
jgi:hypothetical protein